MEWKEAYKIVSLLGFCNVSLLPLMEVLPIMEMVPLLELIVQVRGMCKVCNSCLCYVISF